MGRFVGWLGTRLEVLLPTLDIEDVLSLLGSKIAEPGRSFSSEVTEAALSLTLDAKLGSEGLPQPPGKPLAGGDRLPGPNPPVLKCP